MSTQLVKQLKIKTSTLKRLKKEYISYDKETKVLGQKIVVLETKQQENDDEELQIDIKKNKEFLTESETVLSNVKQKLIEAFEALASFLSEKSGQEALQETEELKVAEQTVLDAQTFLENIA